MILLTVFAFIGGVVTILSPCILPVLPIVLSGGVGAGKWRPYGVVSGFIVSFTFFTLALSTIVAISGISSDTLRNISIIVLLLFGASLLFPKIQLKLEQFASNLFGRQGKRAIGSGYVGGFIVGLSLGLLWTPCIGPILASIITLAASNTVNGVSVAITLSYSLGTAIPMLIIMKWGRSAINKLPWLLPNTGIIQKIFGIVMIGTALLIYFNVDKIFQTYILDTFPNYSEGITSLENNDVVKDELEKLRLR